MEGVKGPQLSAFHEALRASIRGHALMTYPIAPPEERSGVAYLAVVLPQLTQPVRMKHPFLELEMELPPLLSPRVFYLASTGEYELPDLELLQRHVKPEDAVMEVGGGIGLTAAVSAKASGRAVVVVEPDERLFPIIRRQVELNGGEVSFVHGAVSAAEPTAGAADVEFFLHEDVWVSSLRAGAPGERSSIRVPRLSLAEVFTAHRPSVAMVDVEGAEQGLFEGAYPHLPATLLIEVHFPLFGEEQGARVIQSIIDHGYRLIDCRGWTFVFRRG